MEFVSAARRHAARCIAGEATPKRNDIRKCEEEFNILSADSVYRERLRRHGSIEFVSAARRNAAKCIAGDATVERINIRKGEEGFNILGVHSVCRERLGGGLMEFVPAERRSAGRCIASGATLVRVSSGAIRRGSYRVICLAPTEFLVDSYVDMTHLKLLRRRLDPPTLYRYEVGRCIAGRIPASPKPTRRGTS